MDNRADPQPIRRLDESLINRIAAGEIIHRPASALKELLENSLDAGATSIRVTVKDGGMKLLQIQDNGCGIRITDLPILAERFTTSKLSSYSDLSRIQTYGFRGEALASMSHVSHLSVVSKTKTDNCAWKAHYADGNLIPAKPGQTAEPKPCAGNNGTTITIEDLFYNTPTRLSALRSASEEYARILDVMTKYAVHNPSVSFVCKKAGSPSPDLSTPASAASPAGTQAIIRMTYGSSIVKELIHYYYSSGGDSSDAQGEQKENEDDDMDTEDDVSPKDWSFDAHFTNPNYHAKKMVFLLFINHRLVESSRLKRAIEGVYATILPKGASPFVYLSIQLHPSTVDVNVHPTKREVQFLNEEEIFATIADSVQEKLGQQGGSSRTFQVQVSPVAASDDEDEGGSGEATPIPPRTTKPIPSHFKVRTSAADRTLDSMFPVVNPSLRTQLPADTQPLATAAGTQLTEYKRTIRESQCRLKSVQTMRKEIEAARHQQLTEIIEKHIFVGIVDLTKTLSLLQHSTRLYLVNHCSLAEELFYQLGVRQFGDLSRMKLSPPPSLRTLVKLGISAEDIEGQTTLKREDIVEKIVEILVARRDMLSDYFSMDITEDGNLESLPLLLRDYTPNLDKLPNFVMRLGPQVDWTSEQGCFESFLRELAYFYVPGPGPFAPLGDAFQPGVDAEKAVTGADEEKTERWQIEHVLFAAMRKYLVPPKALLERDVVQVADLPDLYKIFERC
uniref:DNA mismatch repair protein S5 domain-containing protein n=1 Tax=Schizophyllum commune (strain H4-8 / FGSC 9210) TaxID=578458 RepID=D8QEE1_SCHCM